jgi:hypothetical protein
VIGGLLAGLVAVAQPTTVVTVDPGHRIVEGVASDGRTIWLSSVLDSTILACTTKCTTLARLPAGLHPFAIAWDGTRRRLWVAADCPPKVPGIVECARGALVGLDRRGRVMTRVAPLSGSFHPGDVSVTAAGLFVSDSQNGAVYRLAGSALKALVEPGVGKSAQGSAIDAYGKWLLVADYSQGISRIDLASGNRSLLARQDGKPLRGVDGLVRCGPTYYGIYNGADPGALLSITPQGEGVRFDQPLGETTLGDPTQIAYDGKRLLIVTNSGWATIDKPDFKRTTGASVIAVPLRGDCTPFSS